MIDPNFRMTNALGGFKTRLTKEERSRKTQEQVRKEKGFDNYIKNTKKPSFAELKKEADDLYNSKVANENALLAAADEGCLKSDRLKKQASLIKKRREKEAEKAAPAEKTE